MDIKESVQQVIKQEIKLILQPLYTPALQNRLKMLSGDHPELLFFPVLFNIPKQGRGILVWMNLQCLHLDGSTK